MSDVPVPRVAGMGECGGFSRWPGGSMGVVSACRCPHICGSCLSAGKLRGPGRDVSLAPSGSAVWSGDSPCGVQSTGGLVEPPI